LPQYSHQIDLYWETGDDVCSYLNIANAKWRGTAKVGQGDVLLLQHVKQKVSAHKAFDLTEPTSPAGAPKQAVPSSYPKVATGYVNKAGGGYSHKGGSLGSGQVSGSGGGPVTKGGGGFRTK
jgi:hypothetical protein